MKLELFLAADYANITRDGKLNVMGIFSEINASSFPARHPSMQLVIILAAELGEYGQTRDLFVKLLDADGKQLFEISGKIDMLNPIAGRAAKANVILEIKDLVFPSPGPFMFVLLVDKEHKGSITIYANQQEVNQI